VVHSNGIKTHLLSRFVLPSNIPLVWHLHDFYGLRPAAARLLRHASGNVRAGIAISQAVARDAARVLPRVPLTTVMNAVDLQRFAPGVGQDLDRLAGMAPAPNGTFRAGLVATYARWKGHETVLDAAKIVATEEPELPVRWYIIGGPIYLTAAQYSEAELRAGAEARGIADRVGFIPFQSDTAGIYRSLDAVVHASTLPEPFGLTVAEAMACGRAVIVSAAGGALELFEEGRDGLGVQPGDANAIATSVKRLALDPELRAKIGSAARLTTEKRFDAIDYRLHLMEVYRAVVHSVVKSH
jgi:glycosyltransferase involved in cell wall biosynthesis